MAGVVRIGEIAAALGEVGAVMRLVLGVGLLSAGLVAPALAQDVGRTFLDGVRLCTDVAEGEDLADIAGEAGWDKTPLTPRSFQKHGVRVFQMTELNVCSVQTALRPGNLGALHAGIDRLGAERAGLRRVAWREQRRRPGANDIYTIWNWDQSAQGGVISIQIRELPGAHTPKPREQALTATVTFTKSPARLTAVPKTTTSETTSPTAATPTTTAPGLRAAQGVAVKRSVAFEVAFVSAIKACHGAMAGEDLSASAARLKMAPSGQGFAHTIDGMTAKMERRHGGPCKVFASGGMMDVGFVERGVRIITGANMLMALGPKTKTSIPEMGSQYDHWNTRYARTTPKFVATLRLQENQAATQPRPADDYAMVAELDRYAPASTEIAPQGPLYTAVVEALGACAAIERADQVAPAARKLGHVKDVLGDLAGRVLDRGEVRIKHVDSRTSCQLSVYGKAPDDANIYQAVEDWLAASATDVRKLEWKRPVSESGLSWIQSVAQGHIGGRTRKVTVMYYSGATFGSATGPRFMVQIGSPGR